jgi:hypothetical protein
LISQYRCRRAQSEAEVSMWIAYDDDDDNVWWWWWCLMMMMMMMFDDDDGDDKSGWSFVVLSEIIYFSVPN